MSDTEIKSRPVAPAVRRRFRIHLLTGVVLMFAVAGIMYVSIWERPVLNVWLGNKGVFAEWSKKAGWPITAVTLSKNAVEPVALNYSDFYPTNGSALPKEPPSKPVPPKIPDDVDVLVKEKGEDSRPATPNERETLPNLIDRTNTPGVSDWEYAWQWQAVAVCAAVNVLMLAALAFVCEWGMRRWYAAKS